MASKYYNMRTVPIWLEALRSGKYEQATGALKKVDDDGNFSYCCLGVWAEVVGDKRLEITPEDDAEKESGNISKVYSAQNPLVGDLELPYKNDEDDWSFEQIADLVESRLLGGKKTDA